MVFNKRGPVTLTAKTKMFAAYFALFLVIFWGNIGQGQANEAKQPKDEINGMVALSVYFACSDWRKKTFLVIKLRKFGIASFDSKTIRFFLALKSVTMP